MGNSVKTEGCHGQKIDNLPVFQTNPADFPEYPIERNQCLFTSFSEMHPQGDGLKNIA